MPSESTRNGMSSIVDFDDRVRRCPAVARFVGVEYTHQRLCGLAHGAKRRCASASGSQLLAAIFGQILFADAVVVLADEFLAGSGSRALAQRGASRRDALDQFLAGSGNGDRSWSERGTRAKRARIITEFGSAASAKRAWPARSGVRAGGPAPGGRWG